MNYLNYLSTLTQDDFWMFHVFGVVLVTAMLQMIAKRICNKLIGKAEKTRTFYDEALMKAITSPLTFLIWLMGLTMASSIVFDHNKTLFIFQYAPQLKKLGIIIALSWSAIRFIKNVEVFYIQHCEEHSKEVDKTLVHAIGQLSTASVVITTVLIGMQIFGLPISGLLAFGGIGGAAIAFASKDMLSNFFGSMVIYLDRPFKVGDWIRSPDKQIEGTVEFIGWRVTRIRTFDKRPLYVPNGIFLTISVENASRMTNRRIKTNIGIRYQDADKMDVITNQVTQMLQTHPEIDQKQTTFVNFVEYGPSSLNFLVYTFTKTTNWVKFQAIQHEIFLKIIEIIESNQAECAFPTQTLHLQNDFANASGQLSRVASN